MARRVGVGPDVYCRRDRRQVEIGTLVKAAEELL